MSNMEAVINLIFDFQKEYYPEYSLCSNADSLGHPNKKSGMRQVQLRAH